MLERLLESVPWWDLLVVLLVVRAAAAGWGGGVRHVVRSAEWFCRFAFCAFVVVMATEILVMGMMSDSGPSVLDQASALVGALWLEMRVACARAVLFFGAFFSDFASAREIGLRAAGVVLAALAGWAFMEALLLATAFYSGGRRPALAAVVEKLTKWLERTVPDRWARAGAATWAALWRLAAAGFWLRSLEDGLQSLAHYAELVFRAKEPPAWMALMTNLAESFARSPLAAAGAGMVRDLLRLVLTGEVGR